jgi:hypothetical protein
MIIEKQAVGDNMAGLDGVKLRQKLWANGGSVGVW